MHTYRIALSEGDSVGKELIAQVRKTLCALESRFDVKFDVVDILSCGPAIDKLGEPISAEELEKLKSCRALLFGNIGSEKYRVLPNEKWPEQALIKSRKVFSVCTNLRAVKIHPDLVKFSPLKEEIVKQGLDIVVIRDLMGGMITGEKKTGTVNGVREASDLEYYNERMIEINSRLAFESALARRKKVTSLDKANVLSSSRLWREKVRELAAERPELEVNNMFIDNAAMQVVTKPSDFDVILTSNVFGDIIADEITQLSGTPWLYGSAEIAQDGRGIYTPNQLHHPRGDELAGKDEVSPYGILAALSLLLEHSLGRKDMADCVNAAVEEAVSNKWFTAEQEVNGSNAVGTDELGSKIARIISK